MGIYSDVCYIPLQVLSPIILVTIILLIIFYILFFNYDNILTAMLFHKFLICY